MKRIWIFRICALAILLFIALKPTITRPAEGSASKWALLIDTSGSMRVKDPDERLERVKRIAQSTVKKVARLDTFKFGEQTEKIDSKDISALKPSGRKSDMATAFKDVVGGDSYRGAIVMTDGRNVGAGDPVSAAAAAGRPLMLVGVGDRALFKDIAVRSIQSPPFAFKNMQASLAATLSIVGFPGQEITVKLREGEKVLSLQKVQATGNDIETTINFSWIPTTVGSKVLTVEASQYTGEVTNVNNKKEVTLDVGRDRFRVLYICGQPGPEYGFLRYQFKSDPAVELVTFVILRNAVNNVPVAETELSLIPFPTQDVLINQMATFDLIVFEEFAYQQYGLLPSVLYAIRQKVQDGGSFLILGGQVAFSANGGYALPGVNEMIPIQFSGGIPDVHEGPIKFKAKAPSHPILRIDQNPERNQEIWKNLPPLEGVVLLNGVKPGATVLGTVEANGKEYPALTVWRYGKGRVAALTARTTWRWSMVPGAKSQSIDTYQQFWKNMVLWLTHSDEFKNVRVAIEPKDVRQGDTAWARVWVYDEYFKPLSDVEVHMKLRSPGTEEVVLQANAETSGVYAAEFKSEQLGPHEIEAWVVRNGKRFGQDRLKFRVVENFFEEEDLRPDFDSLKELAHTTNGQFVKADDFNPAMIEQFEKDIFKNTGKKVLLWNSPWVLLLILGFLGVEWFARKRMGLP